MPIQLEPDWGRKRRYKGADYAKDIILHCKTPADEVEFAKKHNLKPTTVRNIRNGLRWRKLRKQLREENISG